MPLPGRFTFRKEVRWAPEPVWTGVENPARMGIRSPDCPASRESLYWLSYIGPPGSVRTWQILKISFRKFSDSPSRSHTVVINLISGKYALSHAWSTHSLRVTCSSQHFLMLPAETFGMFPCFLGKAERERRSNFENLLVVEVWRHTLNYYLFQMKPTRCKLLLSIFISTSLHVSGNCVLIIRRTYCICWLGWDCVSSQPADQTHTEWKIPVSHRYSKFSWWWAHSCLKHVEKLK